MLLLHKKCASLRSAQYVRAKKLISDMKAYNTTDHTWELLQTPGITKEEQKVLWQTDKQIVMGEVKEPWWAGELKIQVSERSERAL